ncbi:MAG: hypothetical protein ABFD92_08710 [Planctomycetaceae bacterium]|nr:hypothetical protein [Planctomycetaceae bacterium]
MIIHSPPGLAPGGFLFRDALPQCVDATRAGFRRPLMTMYLWLQGRDYFFFFLATFLVVFFAAFFVTFFLAMLQAPSRGGICLRYRGNLVSRASTGG